MSRLLEVSIQNEQQMKILSMAALVAALAAAPAALCTAGVCPNRHQGVDCEKAR